MARAGCCVGNLLFRLVGRLVSRISCMHFAKQMLPGGDTELCVGKKRAMHETLVRVSASPWPAFFKPAKTWEETLWYLVFFHHTRIDMLLLEMCFGGALQRSQLHSMHDFSLSCSFSVSSPSSFLPFLRSCLSSWYFKDDRQRLGLCLQTARHRRTGISFRSLFHVYFRNYFRGVSWSCITPL